MRAPKSPQAEERALGALRDRPAETADGVRLRLEANLEIADEVHRVKEVGAEGIGLYRSEFLLDAFGPDGAGEEAQYRNVSRPARRDASAARDDSDL